MQESVLSELTTDPDFGRIWCNLISDRDFDYQKNKYRYRVGQPMGFYSSWAVFALTHHCVVRAAAARSGVTKPQYALLGDDIVLEAAIAPAYLQLLRELGVGISTGKSL